MPVDRYFNAQRSSKCCCHDLFFRSQSAPKSVCLLRFQCHKNSTRLPLRLSAALAHSAPKTSLAPPVSNLFLRQSTASPRRPLFPAPFASSRSCRLADMTFQIPDWPVVHQRNFWTIGRVFYWHPCKYANCILMRATRREVSAVSQTACSHRQSAVSKVPTTYLRRGEARSDKE